MVWSNTLSYLTTFNNIHHLDFLAGYEIDDTTYNDYLSGSPQFTTPDKHAISNGMKIVSVEVIEVQTGILFKPFELRLQNKYYLRTVFC